MKRNAFLEKVHSILVLFGVADFILAIIDGLSSFSSGLDFVSIVRIVTICINGLIFLLMAAILKELLNMIYDLQENISNKEDKKIQFNQGEAQQKINEELNQYSDSIFFK